MFRTSQLLLKCKTCVFHISSGKRENLCKNNKAVIHAHCQRDFGPCTSSSCFCCPLERCPSAQIQVQGCGMHLSSAQRQEQFPSLGWEQSLVASQCHLLGHAWLLYIECAHWKCQFCQLNYRRGFWFLITFFSVFRPAWSSFCVLQVSVSSQCHQETFNASLH